ncbi:MULTISPECIES: type II toxin-antitoxin system HicA family toxin [unclassified Pseudomonas]|uniref:type II toxin-antitoxin system HicA family toxin n=1 Tax=unclassified Pseudomonas TaxID=196821 RepID=UPI001F5871C8
MQSRQLIKELEEAGWVLDRITGSHHIFTHRYNPYTIPVPHPKKDLPLGTVKSIRRRAGLYNPSASYQGDP